MYDDRTILYYIIYVLILQFNDVLSCILDSIVILVCCKFFSKFWLECSSDILCLSEKSR